MWTLKDTQERELSRGLRLFGVGCFNGYQAFSCCAQRDLGERGIAVWERKSQQGLKVLDEVGESC